ncbi:hypothetical protein CRYUN_Cryun34aG0038600 [Craigia yunnanensis]
MLGISLPVCLRFCEAYWQVNPNLHPAMGHLFGIWSTVFPPSVLRKIQMQLQFSQSANQQSSGVILFWSSESPHPTHGFFNGFCCNKQRIAHLDVKPQNILLDDNFNVKISDFWLSKLINRDQSQVVARIRGILGYLAPEWQHSRITVKADIYSFGIVRLEVVTGRMILDYSQPDSDFCLLNLLKKNCLENRLMNIIDLTNEDLQQHLEEVIAMIMLGLWCVNEDHTRRPCMYSVVKLLEGEKIYQLAT